MANATWGESVGVELEFSSIPWTAFSARGNIPSGWMLDRDGSVTFDVPTIGNMVVDVPRGLERLVAWERVGGELISPILSFEEADVLVSDVRRVIDTLRESREEITDLASVHVHLGIGQYPSAKTMKEIIKLLVAIEAPMFRLSVGELGKHRGTCHNDYMYCRPVTGNGPQYVLGADSSWYKAFDLRKILTFAKTTEEMIAAWCCANYQPRKWIPARYYWFHMASVFNRGTLEIRCFNETLHSEYVLAWMDLVRAIFHKAVFEPQPFPDFPLGREVPIGWDREGFGIKDFFSIIDPKLFFFPATKKTLEELWFKSEWQPGVRPQVSHLCVTSDPFRVNFRNIKSSLRPETANSDVVAKAYDEAAEWHRDNHHRRRVNVSGSPQDEFIEEPSDRIEPPRIQPMEGQFTRERPRQPRTTEAEFNQIVENIVNARNNSVGTTTSTSTVTTGEPLYYVQT